MFPWLAAATIAAPIVGNLLGGGSKKGQTGVTGPSVVTLPQYSFTEPRLKLTSDFISGNIQNLSEGKYPTYYQNALPALRENMSRPLKETFFGSGGLNGSNGTSIMDQIRSTGAALGVGPKATVARENKALYDYASKNQEIDEYLTKLGVDIASQDSRYFTQASIAMPQGPSAQVVPGQGYNVPQAPNYTSDFLKTAGAALPYLMGSQASPNSSTTSGSGYDYASYGASSPPNGWYSNSAVGYNPPYAYSSSAPTATNWGTTSYMY